MSEFSPTQTIENPSQPVGQYEGAYERVVLDVALGAAATQELVQYQAPSVESLALPESIDERIEVACAESSFKATPEVHEAISGYYKDHYTFGSALETVLNGTATPEDAAAVEDGISNHLLRETALDIMSTAQDPEKRSLALLKAENAIYHTMFRERAVASETLSEPEQMYAMQLAETVRDTIINEGHAIKAWGEDRYVWDETKLQRQDLISQGIEAPAAGGHLEIKNVLKLRDIADTEQKTFWDDTRFAGQLEFHNTGNFLDIAGNDYTLRSRTRQKQLSGSYNAQMYGNQRSFGMHSNLPHFSETYSPGEYKDDTLNHTENFPGTLAVPLAEIIKVAPYARNSEYGIVELKDAADLQKVVVKDAVGSLGEQGEDLGGRHGEDRVFMADYRADHAGDAVNYDLKASEGSLQVFTETEKYVAHDGRGFSSGQHLPGIEVLPYKDFNDPMSPRGLPFEQQQAVYATEKQKLAEAIRSMQAGSRARYGNQVVVPLRSGVIEFASEAAPILHRGSYQQAVRHSAA